MRSFVLAVLAALGTALAMVPGLAGAQAPELEIRADKGGYVAGEAATVIVSGLTECAGRTVSIGMRGAARGEHFAEAEATLDAAGGGSVRVPLMTDNGGTPVQPAVWADCVDRGFEPGLALAPHPLLISVSLLSESEIVAFLPAGAAAIARAVARGDLAGITGALAPGEVIQTAYPGDGGPVPRETAAAALRERLLPGAGSDAYGLGRLGLLGAWKIGSDTAVLASFIRSDGARHVQALGIGEVDGRWYITSYGNVALSTGILESYALQGTVRLGSIGPVAPGAPNTGDSRQAMPAHPIRDSLIVAVLAGVGGALSWLAVSVAASAVARRTGGLPPPGA